MIGSAILLKPPKGTSLCGTSSFDVFYVKNRAVVLAEGDWGVHGKVAHAQKRNRLPNIDKILSVSRLPWRNHLCRFWWRSVKGFAGGGGQILLLPPPKKEVYVFGAVCLSVCPSDYSQTCERILTKFFGGVGHGSRTKWYNFGAIWITLRIRESKVRNPHPPDRRRFVLSECISCFAYTFVVVFTNTVDKDISVGARLTLGSKTFWPKIYVWKKFIKCAAKIMFCILIKNGFRNSKLYFKYTWNDKPNTVKK